MVRFKNRWLLVDVTFQSDSDINATQLPSSTLTLLRIIRSSLQDNFGNVASGALGGSIAIKYYSSSTQTAILRCPRVGVKEVWGALTLCNEWEGKSVRLVTLHCGGTIRKVQEAAIHINRKRIQTLYREKKRLSNLSRPKLFQGNDQETIEEGSSLLQLDSEAISAIEQDKRVINAIQQ